MAIKKEIIKELEIVSKQNGGALRPADVVDYARSKDTALHARFEWDDSVAAEEHRRSQARSILQSVVVDKSSKSETKRAFLNVVVDGGHVYLPSATVLSKKSLRDQTVRSGFSDLDQWLNLYGGLSEFSQLAVVIRDAIAIG